MDSPTFNAIESIVGNVLVTIRDVTAESIAKPKTSSRTAALTRILPSEVFSFFNSSKIVTEIVMLVALSAAPITTEVVQSRPTPIETKYPISKGSVTPPIPTVAALIPAFRKS